VSLDKQDPRDATLAEAEAVSDARRLRALTHPVRLALIGKLVLHGPLTAAAASELIGEPPLTCSFHFRQLAKYGVVEEAGGGKGRAKPWRMTTAGFSVTAADDPESKVAEDALHRMLREQQIDDYRTWLNTRSTYPQRWQGAGDDSAYVIHLTVEELEQLTTDLTSILMPLFLQRMADPSKRPAGSVPVRVLLLSHPTAHPEPGEPETGLRDERARGWAGRPRRGRRAPRWGRDRCPCGATAASGCSGPASFCPTPAARWA
jgi:Helix-turn-helix domain